MKKRISPLLVFMTLMSVAQTIYALQPEQAFLMLPPSAPPLPTNASVLFTWGNTPVAQIISYRLVVSKTPDFSGYNATTKACNNTCFTTTVQKTNYLLPISNAILKADNNYYWRIEATNTGGASLSDIHAFSFGAAAPALDPKFLVPIPNLTAVSVLPTSVIQGTPLTISATLDIPLPAGFVAKVDYGTGNGLLLMTGSGTSYSLAQTPTKLGTQSFNVGIYDNKGVLKSKKLAGSFKVTAPVLLPVPPVLSLVSKVSMILKVDVNNVYTIQFSATDKNSDLRLISIDWGDGSSDSRNVADGKTVPFTHTYTAAGSFTWSATAYDYTDPASNIISQTVTVLLPEPPVLSLVSKDMISKVDVNNVYTIQLSATDKNSDLRSISIDWLDGSTDSRNVADGATVSFTHTYTAAGSFTWSATAYDYTHAASNIISQPVTVSVPVDPTTGIVTPPRYFEVAEDGTDLPDQAILMKNAGAKTDALVGAGANGWACTRDDKTKLIWELKTNNGDLHDKRWTYSWYEPDATKNGGYAGAQNGGSCRGSDCDTAAYIKAVNAQTLCGASDWRLPTNEELKGLVYCADGESKGFDAVKGGYICTTPSSPTIDSIYFPNTLSDWFWSSTTYVAPAYVPIPPKTKVSTTKPPKQLPIPKIYADSAWDTSFYYGYNYRHSKSNYAGVRLVRNAAATTGTTATTKATTTATTTTP